MEYSQRACCGAVILSIAAALAPAAIATDAASPQTPRLQDWTIPAGDLAECLTAFSKQSSLQVVISVRMVAGHRCTALFDRASEADALRALLSQTPFEPLVQDGFVTLQRREIEPVAAPAKETPQPVQAVIEVLGYRSAFARALHRKRDARQVLDSVSAESIGKFPDRNVSESLQRLPGIQITRALGRGEAISIRGLSPLFTRVEIDGRRTRVTKENVNPERFSVLTQFASDLYHSIAVVKSPTAADVEGAIGGIVRLESAKPLSLDPTLRRIEVSGSLGETSGNLEPLLSALASKRSDDGRVGGLVHVIYRQDRRDIDTIRNGRPPEAIADRLVSGDDPALADSLALSRVGYWQRRGDNDIWNVNARAELAPSKRLSVDGGAFLTTERKDEIDLRRSVTFSNAVLADQSLLFDTRSALPFTSRRGIVQQAAWTDALLSIDEQENRYAHEVIGADLAFTWRDGDRWTLSGSTQYSRSDERLVRGASASSTIGVTVGYSLLDDEERPQLRFLDPIAVADQATNAPLTRLRREDRVLRVDEFAARLDGRLALLPRADAAISIGVRYSDLQVERQVIRIDSPLTLEGTFRRADGASLSPAFFDPNWFSPHAPESNLPNVRHVRPLSLYARAPAVGSGDFSLEENARLPDVFIDERALATYAMADFAPRVGALALTGNVGLRYVHLRSGGRGGVEVATTSLGENDAEAIGATQFLVLPREREDTSQWLPSLNLTLGHEAYPDVLLRLAVARTITAPDFTSVAPSLQVELTETDGVLDPLATRAQGGNLALAPARSWNLEAGVEYYFGATAEGLLAVNVFSKRIDGLVSETLAIAPEPLVLDALPLPIVEYLRPVGEDRATVNGVECTLQMPLGLLTDRLAGVGVVANYTYTAASIRDRNEVARGLPGNSRNSANASVFYDGAALSLRLSYTYRSNYLRTGSETVAADGRLDFALRYRFRPGLQLNVDINNLGREAEYRYQDDPLSFSHRENEARVFTAGVVWTF